MAKHLLTTTFLACLPDIQSAIKIGSDGMRIQLDIPETEKPKAVPLIAMTHKVLEVTIRELTKEENQALIFNAEPEGGSNNSRHELTKNPIYNKQK
jgi:hypothetical protein